MLDFVSLLPFFFVKSVVGNDPLEVVTVLPFPLTYTQWVTSVQLCVCYHYYLHLSHTNSLLIDRRVCHFHSGETNDVHFTQWIRKCTYFHDEFFGGMQTVFCYVDKRLMSTQHVPIFKWTIIQCLTLYFVRTNRHPILNVQHDIGFYLFSVLSSSSSSSQHRSCERVVLSYS